MNADLLAMLGGGMGGVRPQQQQPRDDGKIIFTIKAGKMTTELLENGKYKVTPIKTRGELNLLWQSAPSSTSGGSGNNSSGQLKFEWKDRRTYAKDLQHSIFQDDGVTFRRVVKDVRSDDRVYIMQWSSSDDRRYFFWLQDRNTSDDDELVIKLNELLGDHIKCATEAGDERSVAAIRAASTTSGSGGTGGTTTTTSTTTIDSNALSQALQNAGAAGAGAGAGDTPQQVDALSSILENLGIPPPAAASSTTTTSGSSSTPSEPGTTAASTSTNPQSSSSSSSLTLADLQGAMAGLQTTSPGSSPPATGTTAGASSSTTTTTTTTTPQSNETNKNNEPTKEEEEESKDDEEEKMEE